MSSGTEKDIARGAAANRFFQSSWVVPDLDEAIEKWVTHLKVGPFLRFGESQFKDASYRGQIHELRIRGALAQAGDIQIELIQQVNDAPSAYRDMVETGRTGFHHLGMITKDFDGDIARYEEAGFQIAGMGRSGQSRFAYVDTSPAFGFMIEILDPSPVALASYDLAKKLALEWDGTTRSVAFKDFVSTSIMS